MKPIVPEQTPLSKLTAHLLFDMLLLHSIDKQIMSQLPSDWLILIVSPPYPISSIQKWSICGISCRKKSTLVLLVVPILQH